MCCKIIKLEITSQPSSSSGVNPCVAEPPDRVRRINICEIGKRKQLNMQFTLQPGRERERVRGQRAGCAGHERTAESHFSLFCIKMNEAVIVLNKLSRGRQ